MYPYNNDTPTKIVASESENMISPMTSPMKSITLDEVLSMLSMAIADERRDGDFYNNLTRMVQNPEDLKLVKDNYLDERRHEKTLTDLYIKLSGTAPIIQFDTPVGVEANMVHNFEKAFLGELEGFNFYRTLYLALNDPYLRNVVFEIMTDEQQHAVKDSFLANKYRAYQK